ncbi:hypothetical protein AB1Y20_014273 [Prymnesium parvum]|uniref:Uncharacterized protein n=1 Tax=Prymnesium parvum TaxID=97485 RepID=A0AB34IFQ3_PRYPA
MGVALSASGADKSRPYNYKGEIHSASASSHIHALPANGVAALLHRRLHVGIDHIRRLGRFSVDAPAHVASASRLTCEDYCDVRRPGFMAPAIQ